MSISDSLMFKYATLLLHTPAHVQQEQQAKIINGELHPMDLKKTIAHAIVAKFWGNESAISAQKHFEELFQNRDYTNAEHITLSKHDDYWIVQLLKEIGAVESSSDARRMLEQGAVTIDGNVVSDFKATINPKSGMIIKVGKKKIVKIS